MQRCCLCPINAACDHALRVLLSALVGGINTGHCRSLSPAELLWHTMSCSGRHDGVPMQRVQAERLVRSIYRDDFDVFGYSTQLADAIA
eukprot:m.1447115 g.1447115  ORF g.1447115 m.1447115 type:complete len:89 (-) comp25107_c0_seq109:1207-1473(-)